MIGTANEQTWLALDDTVALGAGICVTTDTSHFTLIRRLTGPGSNKGYSVSCDSFGDLGILPADEVLLEGIRYTIVGMDSEGQVMAMNRDTNEVTSLSAPEISQCSVVYRADLPATRSYLSKTGCLLDLQVSLSDFIGKGNYVLMDMWASWCGPCKGEIPNLARLHNQYKDKGLTVIGLFVWDKQENLKKAMESEGITWPQIVDEESKSTQVYGVDGIPHIILFSPDGTILKRNLRGDAMIKTVEEIMNRK